MLLYVLHCIYCIKSIHFNSCYFFKNIYIYYKKVCTLQIVIIILVL